MSELPYIFIETAKPGGKKYPAGAVEFSHYKIVDDGRAVTLCTPKGTPTGNRRPVHPGETAREAAARLLRARTKKSDRPAGFGRQLNYGPPIKY
jgi:hypothetical protein